MDVPLLLMLPSSNFHSYKSTTPNAVLLLALLLNICFVVDSVSSLAVGGGLFTFFQVSVMRI